MFQSRWSAEPKKKNGSRKKKLNMRNNKKKTYYNIRQKRVIGAITKRERKGKNKNKETSKLLLRLCLLVLFRVVRNTLELVLVNNIRLCTPQKSNVPPWHTLPHPAGKTTSHQKNTWIIPESRPLSFYSSILIVVYNTTVNPTRISKQDVTFWMKTYV